MHIELGKYCIYNKVIFLENYRYKMQVVLFNYFSHGLELYKSGR